MKAVVLCTKLESTTAWDRYLFQIEGLEPDRLYVEVQWSRQLPESAKRIDIEHLIIQKGYPWHFYEALIRYLEGCGFRNFPCERAVEVFW